MSRRRAPRHLALVAVGSGLVTLMVAVTAATPVWLAAGPLLLVILDTLLYSPMVRSRLSQLGAVLLRSALPASGWGDPAYRSSLREELRMARRELADAPLPRRLLWELGVFRYFLPAYIANSLLLPILGAGLVLVATGVAGFVSETGGPLGVALTSVGGALLTIALSFSVRALAHGPTIYYAASPVPWLQDEMDASGATMPLLMFSFSDQSDPAMIGALLTLAIPRSRGHALVTLDHNLLVTGSDHDLARLLAALPAHIPVAHRAGLRVSRADYPQDGNTPEALLSAAMARLAPLDEAESDS